MKIAAALLLILAAYYRGGPLFFAVGVALLLWIGARLWLRAAGTALRVDRALEPRLFFGEVATVRLTFANGSTLPIPWLEIHESLPAALALPNVLSRVLRLAPRQQTSISYTLTGRRRGFHAIGPLTATVGDVYGLARRETRFSDRQHLLVYPRILTVDELELPALAMFGVARSRRRLTGDPSRLAGVRQYTPGDPLHDIHWPASAATGTLQVKQYQPATTLQTVIYLDLQRAGYSAGDVLSAAEFAISVAATVASRLIEQRQEVGLVTNGQITLPTTDDGAGGHDEPWMANSILVSGHASYDSGIRPHSPAGSSRTLPSDHGPSWRLRAPAPPMNIGNRTGASRGSARAHSNPSDPSDFHASRSPRATPIGPAKGRAQLMRLLEVLARVQVTEHGESLIQLLAHRNPALPWGSTVVVVTGSTGDDLFLTLNKLRQSGVLVVLFLIEANPDLAAVEARARAVGVALKVAWRDADVQAVHA